jgi:hypothetical protein
MKLNCVPCVPKALLLMCVCLLLAACGELEIGIERTPTLPATAVLTPTSTSAVVVPSPTATHTAAAPDPTPTPLPPTPTPEPPPTRILFARNATSATVTDTLQPMGADRYVLRALAGQILIVDIAAPHPVLLYVWGADSTVLKSDMEGTTHWQGTLASTQDYFVELVSTGPEIEYQMTVTIPELVAPTPAWNVYRNAEYHFEIQYPADLQVKVDCAPAALMGDAIVGFWLTGTQYYTGTNLAQACVMVGVGQNEEARTTCLTPTVPHKESMGTKEINSVVFYQSSRVEGAAGNVYDVTWYRTLYDGACYEIALYLHSHNMGVYEPGTVSEFDRETVIDRLTQVLYTFRFTE